jgi:hypothetical protein
MSDDEEGGAEDGNIEIYLRIKPIANPSKKVEYDLAEGKARGGRCAALREEKGAWRRGRRQKETRRAAHASAAWRCAGALRARGAVWLERAAAALGVAARDSAAAAAHAHASCVQG